MTHMTMTFDTLEDYVRACALLVTEGTHFDGYRKDGRWIIELTGGY
jgi:hypothetical protein